MAVIDDLSVLLERKQETYGLIPVTEDTLHVMLPAAHPLATKQSLTVVDLRGQDWALDSTSSAFSDFIANLCRRSGFEPRLNARCKGFEMVAAMVTSGGSVSVVRGLRLVRPLQSAKAIRLRPEVMRKISVAYRKGLRRRRVRTWIPRLRDPPLVQEALMVCKHLIALVAGLAWAGAASAVTVFSDDFDANEVGADRTPAGWSAAPPGVDIFGTSGSASFMDVRPGNGAYVNVRGTFSTGVDFVAHVPYIVTFDLADHPGDQVGPVSVGNVFFGGQRLPYALSASTPFTTFSVSYTSHVAALMGLWFEPDAGEVLVDNVVVTAVPEPRIAGFMLAGLVVIAAVFRRRKD